MRWLRGSEKSIYGVKSAMALGEPRHFSKRHCYSVMLRHSTQGSQIALYYFFFVETFLTASKRYSAVLKVDLSVKTEFLANSIANENLIV